MKIALDVGHMGKSSKPNDRGGCFKGTNEADMALLYALSAYKHLERNGQTCFLMTYGNYSTRHTFCRNNSIGLHIQCHVNSGQGNYSLIYCRRGNTGIDLAEIISSKFLERLPVAKSKYQSIDRDVRGYSCLMNNIPSILIEPLFLDNENHYEELVNGDACFTIGEVIAESVLEWMQLTERE